MKVKHIPLLLLVCLTFNTSGQPGLNKIIHVWGNEFWTFSTITIDHHGNLYLAGEFYDTIFLGSENNYLVNVDSSDSFIIKISANGTVDWTKVIYGTGSETLYDLEVDKDENVYIIGQFDHSMVIDNNFYDTEGLFESEWTGDHFIGKLDPDGNLSDLRRGTENGEHLIFREIELDDNGQVFLIGHTEENQAFDFQFEPAAGNRRNFLVKLDNAFNAGWIVSVYDSMEVQPAGVCWHDAIAPNQLNGIFLAGNTDAHPNYSMYISKLDQEGSVLWIKNIVTTRFTGILDLFTDKHDDTYIITNIATGNIIGFPDPLSGSAFVAKYSTEGDYLWSLGLDLPISHAVVTPDGYSVFTLSKSWPVLDSLIILDPGGEIIYQHSFDSINIQSLAIDESGKVYYNGFFQEKITLGGQNVSPLKSANFVIGQLGIEEIIGNSNIEITRQHDAIKLYPNPTRNLLTIETKITGQHYIDIFTMCGQLNYSTSMAGNTIQLDLSSFSRGVYFITVRSKEFVKTEKIIKL